MLQNIRAYLDYQPIDPLVNFLEVNPERIIRSYHFTSELSRLTARLIEGIAAPKTSEAARLITGPRGAGKSHTLAVVRALACTPKTRHLVSGNPPLANAVKRLEGTTFLPVYLSGAPLLNEVTDFPTLLRTALANIPDTPIAFDDTQWFSVLESQQVCELLASKLFPGMALLFVVDDISDVFRAPRRALVQETLDWLTKLAEKSRSLPFALLLALDSDVTAAHTGTAARLTADYQTDTLTLDNLRRITDQAVFRKTPATGRTGGALPGNPQGTSALSLERRRILQPLPGSPGRAGSRPRTFHLLRKFFPVQFHQRDHRRCPAATADAAHFTR